MIYKKRVQPTRHQKVTKGLKFSKHFQVVPFGPHFQDNVMLTYITIYILYIIYIYIHKKKCIIMIYDIYIYIHIYIY